MIKSSSIQGKVWRFVHTRDEWIKTDLRDRRFENEWLRISPCGLIVVKGSHDRGYAWDGNSPRVNFLNITLGIPDGSFDPDSGRPSTYFASMFHDSLYQFKDVVPISRKEADVIYDLILRQTSFSWRRLYYLFIRAGGHLYGEWKETSFQRDIEIWESSWGLDMQYYHSRSAAEPPMFI